MKEIIIEVEGMRCGMCESHVCDAIRRASDKVKKVTASHLKNFADVIAEDDALSDEIAAAIAAQGYGVGAVTEKPYEKKGFFARFFKK